MIYKMSVKKYRVYCDTEAAFVEGWTTAIPTTCFNNNTHTIDTDQTTMLDVKPPTQISLNQTTDISTQSSYFLVSSTFTVAANTTIDVPIVLDVDSNMFAVYINAKRENSGDKWSTYINKDTVIGTVSATATDTTELKMADASIAVVTPGYFISVDGGATYVRVISKTSDTLTLKSNVTAAIGDVVTLTYFMVFEKTIMNSGETVLGNTIIGSFRIPKEYTAGITYQNNSPSRKTVSIDVETTF